jgi:hypothetical protein
MKTKYIFPILLIVLMGGLISCKKELLEMNENPNGADPQTSNPNLVFSTVLTESGKAFVNLGYLDIAGLMQHTQKDGWATGHNAYDWGGSNSWSNYYNILRNNKYVYDRAVELDYTFHQGASLVMKSLIFGLITDLWGDAPYSQALKGDVEGRENRFPAYDSQQSIYEGILADLEQANTILSGTVTGSPGSSDIYFNGNAMKWRRFANSLALRYYMRLAEKLPAVAKEGIERIAGNPTKYPIITNAADDVAMGFPGNNNGDSWPANATYDSDSTNYRRIKMGQPLVGKMLEFNDPRLGAYANRVEIPIQVDDTLPVGTDRIVVATINGEQRRVRQVHPSVFPAGTTINDINQHPNYVGLPLGLALPYTYNLSPNPTQSSRNPHVSWVNSAFANAKSGIKVRLISAAEVNFILAEAAAVYKWNTGNAATHYNNAVQASFTAWNMGSAASYLAQANVAFNGTQEQILTQKWISSWTMATESWFDWRRTGFPRLQGATQQGVLPVRFYYPLDERNLNEANANAAIEKLQASPFDDPWSGGTKNSIWAKTWLLQGTGKPF